MNNYYTYSSFCKHIHFWDQNIIFRAMMARNVLFFHTLQCFVWNNVAVRTGFLCNRLVPQNRMYDLKAFTRQAGVRIVPHSPLQLS